MCRLVFIVLLALFLAGADRSACAQTAYANDYNWRAESRPVGAQVEYPPSSHTPGSTTPAVFDERIFSGPIPATDPEFETMEIAEPVELAPPPVDLWDGNCELGLNGSEGNVETFNLRFGFDAQRKTDRSLLDLDLDYYKNSVDRLETANRAFFDARYEWLYGDSPWTSFVHHTTEYDEFKAFDVRVSLDSGVGYKFIDNDITLLMGRIGAGASYEIGTPEEQYIIPELTCGLEYERQLSERQKLRASTEFIPNVRDFSDFRLNSSLDWEILLNVDWNLSLKLSILDRYDSTPHGAKANDVDYATTFLWNF